MVKLLLPPTTNMSRMASSEPTTPGRSFIVPLLGNMRTQKLKGVKTAQHSTRQTNGCWSLTLGARMKGLVRPVFLQSLLPLPEGALCLISAAAFCAEYLLFFFHSATHEGLEGHYHLLLVLLVAVCIISVIAGALLPTSFPADLCSGIAITLQGLWFYQTAFTLYGPSMPTGCKLEANEISCSSHDHELHGQLLANVQMFGLVFLVLLGVVGSYIFADKRSIKAEFGVVHMKPLDGFHEQL